MKLVLTKNGYTKNKIITKPNSTQAQLASRRGQRRRGGVGLAPEEEAEGDVLMSAMRGN